MKMKLKRIYHDIKFWPSASDGFGAIEFTFVVSEWPHVIQLVVGSWFQVNLVNEQKKISDQMVRVYGEILPLSDSNPIQQEHRSFNYHLYSKKDPKWVKIIVNLCFSPFGAWSRRKKEPHMNWRPCFLQPGGNDASLAHGTHMDPTNH